MLRSSKVVIPLLVAALVGAAVMRVCLGSYQVALVDVFRIMAGQDILGQRAATFIVMEDRLPRMCLGMVAGAALAVAGGVFQRVLRNPLASPDVMGVNACASAAVVAAMAFLGVGTTGAAVAALAGGLGGAALIVAVSQGRGWLRIEGVQASSMSLVLAGVAVATAAMAVVQFLLTRLNIYSTSDAAVWIAGSLRGATWPRVWAMTAVLAAASVLLWATRRALAVVGVGDALAFCLGVPVPALRWGLLAAATVLSSVACSVAGPITFVPFMVAPAVRFLLKGRDSILATALLGAVLVTVADFVAAELLPVALPVGVATGIVGGPVLLATVVGVKGRAR